ASGFKCPVAWFYWLLAGRCSSQSSLAGHLNRGADGVFETVRVVGRGLVSVAEVHAIVARAHRAQGEPEMSRDRFSFLERHGFVKSCSGRRRFGETVC